MAAKYRSGLHKDAGKGGRQPFHPDAVRKKIQAVMLVNRLQDHIAGKVELSLSQVRAIDILLKKVVPDLTRTLITADVTHRYVAELPKMLTREEWMSKYGAGDHLDLKALPPPTNGSGNGEAH